MRKINRVDHADEVELVEHLDELRSRLIVSALTLAVALGLCFWRNDLVLALLNHPLDGKELITLSPAESFTTTLRVATYAALVISLPVLLYQIYAFIVPAFGPRERRVFTPLLLLVPVLFMAGVAFAYYVVMPAALSFLLNFNQDEFNNQLRAADYYSFAAMTMAAVGLLFQLPVGILALTRLGVTSPEQLREKRKFAYLACTVVAALLPGVDPISMILETVPLIVLYEASIVLASMFGTAGAADSEPSPSPSG